MSGTNQNRNDIIPGILGGISIRHEDDIYIAPSGVQKERILPSELFCTDMAGSKFIKPKNEVSPFSEMPQSLHSSFATYVALYRGAMASLMKLF